MSRAIDFKAAPRDARQELRKRLEEAPEEHAEALLDCYQLLQQLHDSGAIGLLRGIVASGDKIVDSAVNAVNSEKGIRGLRNAIILCKMLGSINPDLLQGFAVAMSEILDSPQAIAEPPGLFRLFAEFRQPEARRSMALVNKFLQTLGTQLQPRGEV